MRVMRPDRKWETVMLYVKEGMSAYKIADRLGISKSSANDYITNWYLNHFGVDVEALEFCLKQIKGDK